MLKQMLKKTILGILALVLFVNIIGCAGDEGTGLTENEVYLELLSTDEVLGIVLFGNYYLLPMPLEAFIENGWHVGGYGTLRFMDLSVATLPPGKFIDVVLEKANMRIIVAVANPTQEDLPLLETHVSSLRTYNAEKDQAVIVGGVTINTSGIDASERMQYLDVPHRGGGSGRGRHNSINISDEARYNGQIWVTVDNHTVRSFSIELRDKYYQFENLDYYFIEASDEAMEEWFMSVSYHFEGVVVGIYYVEIPLGRGETMISGQTIVAEDISGNMFATLRDNRIDLDSIQSGDTIKVYYGHTEHRGSSHEMITYEDGSRIPYVRATILVINGEIHHSLWDR